jgi:hypothetical protein
MALKPTNLPAVGWATITPSAPNETALPTGILLLVVSGP